MLERGFEHRQSAHASRCRRELRTRELVLVDPHPLCDSARDAGLQSLEIRLPLLAETPDEHLIEIFHPTAHVTLEEVRIEPHLDELGAELLHARYRSARERIDLGIATKKSSATPIRAPRSAPRARYCVKSA